MRIYLTNSSTAGGVRRGRASEISRASVGAGPILSIMRWPRADYGEAGDGRVLSLTPPQILAGPALSAKRSFDGGTPEAAAAWLEYEEALREVYARAIRVLGPGQLQYGKLSAAGRPGVVPWDGEAWQRVGPVPDDATLVCACSREAAGNGRCHRVVAADFLRRVGWDVVLDGQALEQLDLGGLQR